MGLFDDAPDAASVAPRVRRNLFADAPEEKIRAARSTPFDDAVAQREAPPVGPFDAAVAQREGSGGNPFDQFDAQPSAGGIRQTAYGPRKALVIGGKPVETPNAIGALGRSIADTATFGLADRIAAAGEALTGLGGDFGDYSGNLAREQAQTEVANAEHPIASIAGTLGGALMAPFGRSCKGRGNSGERVLAGGRAGALQGALYGAGSSQDLTDIPDMAVKAITGAGLGGALGAGLPAVTEGTGRLIRAAANKTGIPQAITGYLNPDAAAARIVGNALQRDREIGAAGLTPQEFGSALDRGQPVVWIGKGRGFLLELAPKTFQRHHQGSKSSLPAHRRPSQALKPLGVRLDAPERISTKPTRAGSLWRSR